MTTGPLLQCSSPDAACFYTLTPDHHFVIAKHPQHDSVIVASPCSGHGYKFCSVVGKFLSELAIDRFEKMIVEGYRRRS